MRRDAQKTRRDARGRAGARTICRRKRFHSRGLQCLAAVLPRVGEKEPNPPDPLARLTPTEPVKRHRGKSERRRRRRGNVGEHQRNGEAETEGIGGERGSLGGVNGEDKELGVGVEVGGVWVGWEGHARRKGRLKKAR